MTETGVADMYSKDLLGRSLELMAQAFCETVCDCGGSCRLLDIDLDAKRNKNADGAVDLLNAVYSGVVICNVCQDQIDVEGMLTNEGRFDLAKFAATLAFKKVMFSLPANPREQAYVDTATNLLFEKWSL